MSSPRRTVAPDDPQIGAAPFAALRDELDIPVSFPADVLTAADQAVARGPDHPRIDRTDLPLVTIDPPGSADLDQAVHIAARADGGLDVSYAIADVAAFVRPDDPIDVEAWARGVSRYSPDLVTPLHPHALSEGAASLLPGQDRPAVLWQLTVDGGGHLVDTHVERALVRSRAQLTYADAQRMIDEGTQPMLAELARLGRLRAEREWVRGGISLELPEQEVAEEDGRWVIRHRAPLPVERWNAQVSLLTGHAAGLLMVDAGVGVLRTLPAPEDDVIDGLRRRAWALGLPWPVEVGYPDFVRTLDPHHGVEAAMIATSAVGLRGAGYAAFDGGAVPDLHRHEAIGAVYAHVTAPLRRLVDRYGSEIALSIVAGTPVPGWVTEKLDELPRAMARARGRAGALDRSVIDLVETLVLAGRVGEEMAATVVKVTDRGSDLQLRDPLVTAQVDQQLTPGADVILRLTAVDRASRTATFEVLDRV